MATKKQTTLGRSNDRPAAVRLEMRAAALIVGRGRDLGKIDCRLTTSAEEGALTACAIHNDPPVSDYAMAQGMPGRGAAGWLAYEIAIHDRQRAEDRAAELARHDVAASVARHAEVDDARARRDAQCAACATSDGCSEHEMFTCANCGALVPWADGGSDDEFGLGGDECSSCYVERTLDAAAADDPVTVTIDSDSEPAVQLNGICEAPPLLTPDEADQLAADLERGADAARQAARDGYHGSAVVVALEVGEDPDARCDHPPDRVERDDVATECHRCGEVSPTVSDVELAAAVGVELEDKIDEMANDGRLSALAMHLAIDAGADWPSLDGDAQDAWHEAAIRKLRGQPVDGISP